MDANLPAMPDAQIGDLERRIKSIIGQEETSAAKVMILMSIPGIGPVSAAMLIAEMPEGGRMTSADAAAMTGLFPIPHDSGAMRGKRAIDGGPHAEICHVTGRAGRSLSQPRSEASRTGSQNTWHPLRLVIVAIARRRVTIANPILKTGLPWKTQPGR